jgi:hypothetical protein
VGLYQSQGVSGQAGSVAEVRVIGMPMSAIYGSLMGRTVLIDGTGAAAAVTYAAERPAEAPFGARAD